MTTIRWIRAKDRSIVNLALLVRLHIDRSRGTNTVIGTTTDGSRIPMFSGSITDVEEYLEQLEDWASG